ncbi:hypothetical protein [Rhinopithecimicrobium faecis]|uniref:hypothetical protein n=1 Tax=Rhinopithecimicrobium faecis TaxID=2820698 RepID=UPI0033658FC5
MYGLKYYFDYLHHFFSSHSRHGTHSPFVYRLAEEVIYTKKIQKLGRREPKESALLKEILCYYSGYKITIYTDRLAYYTALQVTGVCIYPLSLAEGGVNHFQENELVLIDEPYYTVAHKRLWQHWQQDNRVVVSIDLFHFGLIFFRAGQRKEHFKLRF